MSVIAPAPSPGLAVDHNTIVSADEVFILDAGIARDVGDVAWRVGHPWVQRDHRPSRRRLSGSGTIQTLDPTGQPCAIFDATDVPHRRDAFHKQAHAGVRVVDARLAHCHRVTQAVVDLNSPRGSG